MKTALAIDPGSARSGYVIWDGEEIMAKDILPNHLLLTTMNDFSSFVDYCVIENMRTHPQVTVGGHHYVPEQAISTQRYMGRLIERWLLVHDQEPYLLYRSDVTRHLRANRRVGTKDSQVRRALINRIGQPGTKKNPGPTYGMSSHMWAALGVAVTFMDTHPIPDF